MDQIKMGKFISQNRVSKGLTQEKLAEKLGVDRTVVSKWERAVSSPDISLLQPLCEILGISVTELIKGEKESNNFNSDIQTINAIKFYSKETSKKWKKYVMIGIIVSILFFILFTFINNYSDYKEHKIDIFKYDFLVEGLILSNPNRGIIVIKNIEYNNQFTGTDEEVLVKEIIVNIISNNENVYSERWNNDEFVSLNQILENKVIFMDLKKQES